MRQGGRGFGSPVTRIVTYRSDDAPDMTDVSPASNDSTPHDTSHGRSGVGWAALWLSSHGAAYRGRMSDGTTLFPAGLDLVTEQVDATTDWDAPSPCEGWTALDVLAHVTGTVHKALISMGGGAYASVPADAAGGVDASAVVARWHEAAGRAADALLAADPEQVIESPRGPLPLRQALGLPVADMSVHAWDLAASGGRDLALPDDLRAHVERLVRGLPEEKLRSAEMFAPSVEAPSDAGPTDQLMAFLGRSRPRQ